MMLMQIFLPCGKPTPDMPLGFIYIQHLPGLRRQVGVDIEKPLCNVFMNCRLADPKALGGLPHGCIVLYNIICYLNGSFGDVILQGVSLQKSFLHPMIPEKKIYIPFLYFHKPLRAFLESEIKNDAF